MLKDKLYKTHHRKFHYFWRKTLLIIGAFFLTSSSIALPVIVFVNENVIVMDANQS